VSALQPSHTLVLGGQRSGKSRFAEEAIRNSGLAPVYIATATAGDAEMADRIADHRSRRGSLWTTVEEPLDLAAAIGRNAVAGNAVLVDCLTLWLSNLMEADRPVLQQTEHLLSTLSGAKGPVVLVSNEVGTGIIPANRLARRFAEEQGLLNQRVAAAVERVVLMTAGIPMVIKPGPQVSF
jgi:adenosylcobinamide kinase/adenosylcobinamide-phosphate guanylyltransferase